MAYTAQTRPMATLRDYVRIARLDHSTKQIFIIPGIVLAVLLRGVPTEHPLLSILAGFVAAIAIASANYVINEWLDREFDAFHPEKSHRAAVQRLLAPRIVYLEYAGLLTIGMVVAASLSPVFLLVTALFAVSGIVYNVNPLRSKDKAYIDVLSESINNPLRLTLGWTMVDPETLPPASILLAFWFGGAFLMNSKRLAEYRDIVRSDGAEILGRYRRSFRHYTETRLSVANLIYALLSVFFLAVFLVKYRIEYILLFPFIVGLFASYYALALQPDSVARKPEQLYQAPLLMLLVSATAFMFLVTTVVDMPSLGRLAEQHYIGLFAREE